MAASWLRSGLVLAIIAMQAIAQDADAQSAPNAEGQPKQDVDVKTPEASTQPAQPPEEGTNVPKQDVEAKTPQDSTQPAQPAEEATSVQDVKAAAQRVEDATTVQADKVADTILDKEVEEAAGALLDKPAADKNLVKDALASVEGEKKADEILQQEEKAYHAEHDHDDEDVGEEVAEKSSQKEITPDAVSPSGLEVNPFYNAEVDRYICADHEDHEDQCPGWAEEGMCEKDPDSMHEMCKKSCGVCPECFDEWQECKEIVDGEMNRKDGHAGCGMHLMKKCQQSCGRCEVEADKRFKKEGFRGIFSHKKTAREQFQDEHNDAMAETLNAFLDVHPDVMDHELDSKHWRAHQGSLVDKEGKQWLRDNHKSLIDMKELALMQDAERKKEEAELAKLKEESRKAFKERLAREEEMRAKGLLNNTAHPAGHPLSKQDLDLESLNKRALELQQQREEQERLLEEHLKKLQKEREEREEEEKKVRKDKRGAARNSEREGQNEPEKDSKEKSKDSLVDSAELKSMTDLVAKIDGKESKKEEAKQEETTPPPEPEAKQAFPKAPEKKDEHKGKKCYYWQGQFRCIKEEAKKEVKDDGSDDHHGLWSLVYVGTAVFMAGVIYRNISYDDGPLGVQLGDYTTEYSVHPSGEDFRHMELGLTKERNTWMGMMGGAAPLTEARELMGFSNMG